MQSEGGFSVGSNEGDDPVTNHVANEAEHRRGLVLGLTLAEALVLLLFLILLVLGDRLLRVESDLSRFKGATGDAPAIAGESAKMKGLEKSISELKKENSRIRSELAEKTAKLKSFETLI